MAEVEIRDRIAPEDIRRIIERHRNLYETEFGFDQEFAQYVEESLKGKIEHIWIAEYNNEFAGCVGIVEADFLTAQLRWFLVEPTARGKGVGTLLMEKLLEHCHEKKYERIILWTVNTLSSARAVYEKFGFTLTEEKPEKDLWGQKLIEQRWDLSLKRNR
jgi:GNAT superfamily N-acetyltransferase